MAPNPSLDAASEAVPTAEAEAGPTLLWSSDHETRDLSAWHQGGDTMGGEYVGFGTNAISSERAHGGTYSLKFSIDTSDGMDHTARAYRRTAPGPAYYSAWFYFNETHSSFVLVDDVLVSRAHRSAKCRDRGEPVGHRRRAARRTEISRCSFSIT